ARVRRRLARIAEQRDIGAALMLDRVIGEVLREYVPGAAPVHALRALRPCRPLCPGRALWACRALRPLRPGRALCSGRTLRSGRARGPRIALRPRRPLSACGALRALRPGRSLCPGRPDGRDEIPARARRRLADVPEQRDIGGPLMLDRVVGEVLRERAPRPAPVHAFRALRTCRPLCPGCALRPLWAGRALRPLRAGRALRPLRAY